MLCRHAILNVKLVNDFDFIIALKNIYWSTAGTAKVPLGVIMAPGAFGPSTGTIKLRGIPVLLLISIGSPLRQK